MPSNYGPMKESGSKGWVPYIISGPLSREATLTGFADAAIHVGVWIAVWVFEILTYTALMRHQDDVTKDSSSELKDGGHPMLAVSLGSIITLGIASLVVVVVLGAHSMTNGIEDGKLPPVATSAITGGIKASLFFSFMTAITALLIFMMQDISTPTACGSSATKTACQQKMAGTLLTQEETFLDFIVILMLLKFYAISMTINNLRFAVSADQADPRTHTHYVGAV